MKKITLGLVGVTFLFVGYKNLPEGKKDTPGTMSGGAPSASTGAPEEKHCSSPGCHSDFAANSGVAELTGSIGGGIAEYELGKTYPMTVTITNPGLIRFGFQVVALRNSDNTNAGLVKAVDAIRTQVIPGYGSIADRKYITYTYEGTNAVATGMGQWTFEWTAPETNVGPVTLYIAAIAANDDGTDSGDYTYSKRIMLNAPAAVNMSWNIVSNAGSGELSVECSGMPLEALQVYNSSGELVYHTSNIEPGTFPISLNQPAGIYYVSAVQDGKTEVRKVLIAR